MNRSVKGFIIFFLCLLGLKFPLSGQIFVMRNYFPAPLEDTTYAKGFFGKLAFSGEGSRGFGSSLDEQAWNVKYMGLIEFYRFSPRSSIGGSLAHEFTANPYNEISFNLRGVIWNETLAYFHKFRSTTLQLGLTHHCRHEIDNTVPPNRLIDNTDYQPTKRLIVLTAPFFSLQSNWWRKQQFSARFYSRVNFFTYRVDGRRPRGNTEQSLESLRASVLLGGRLDYSLKGPASVYARGWVNPAYFTEEKPIKNNFRFETGISISGRVANFELFSGFERFFDDMSRPYPLPSNVFSVGIRGRSKDLF